MSAPGLARDRGSGTIWVIAMSGLLLVAITVAVLRTEAVLARHRVERAADLVALAAAQQIGVGVDPCGAGGRIAIANGVTIRSCSCDIDESGRSGTVLVVVSRSLTLALVGSRMVSARSAARREPASP